MNVILYTDCSSEDWPRRENSCYKITDEKIHQPECVTSCNAEGGHLATVENHSENEFLETL